MADPFIFINTYKYKPGKEEEAHRSFQRVADIVEAREPKMLYFALHLNEDGTEVTTVQVHADAGNMDYHTQLIDEHIRENVQYIDWSSMSIRIYGSPTETLLQRMREIVATGGTVTVNPAKISVSRLSVLEG